MTHQAATQSEADAPRPWARAILHARIPAALKLLLLALFAALSAASSTRHTARRPHKDWLLSLTTAPTEDPDSSWDPYVLRQLFRRRARLGWLMRCDRAEGMALSGQRAPILRPTQAARAPPSPSSARNHRESVAKTPRPAAITHGQSGNKKKASSSFLKKRTKKLSSVDANTHNHQAITSRHCERSEAIQFFPRRNMDHRLCSIANIQPTLNAKRTTQTRHPQCPLR